MRPVSNDTRVMEQLINGDACVLGQLSLHLVTVVRPPCAVIRCCSYTAGNPLRCKRLASIALNFRHR